MANIEKIKVGSTSYDVRDASAAHSLDEIAIAGSNIEFQSSPFTNYTVVGSGIIINSNYEMTHGDNTNYVYFDYLLSQSPTSFEFVTAVNPQNYVTYIGILGPVGSQNGITLQLGSGRKPQVTISDGIAASLFLGGTTGVPAEEKSYIKLAYDSSTGYTLSSSTDGESWTEQATSSSTTLPYAVSSLMLGYNGTNSLGNSTIYLKDTYMKENGQVIWSAVDTSSKKKINATAPTVTVDQTYNASSANAQSGVAINGAGFLKNAAYGTGSFVIGGTDNTHNNYLTQIGISAKANAVNATAVGYYAQATGAHSIALGSNTGASGDNGISIGYYTQAPGNNSIGIGGTAQGNYSIQLGYGTNGTANTFSVGLSNNLNVQLLDSSGNIPAARLPIVTSVSSASTDSQVPSAKLFYDTCGNITALINAL